MKTAKRGLLPLLLCVFGLAAVFSAGTVDAAAVQDAFIHIPGGTFIMGSPADERQRNVDEAQHSVTLKAFYIDPCEVTQKDYAAIMGGNPSHFKGDDLPVESVTWYDAIAYCNRLSEAKGLKPAYKVEGTTVVWDRRADGYRLPTEAEWEYAARAGSTSVFSSGNQIRSDKANFEGSYPYLIEENYVHHRNPDVVTSRFRGKTIAVSELPANAFGLHNVHGNVSEWCFDCYGDYGALPADNPAGAASGSLRVNRGGGYDDFGKHLRLAYRSATNPKAPDQNLGFRICRNDEGIDETFTTTCALDITLPPHPRILVACYSYSGNTEAAAELIRRMTGADFVRITMQHPYRGDIYEVSQQDLNNNVFPPLASHVDNMADYDVILLGYPTWWATMPMPVFTFLKEYDFRGKTIIPFSSNGGTRFGDSVSDLSKCVPGAHVGIGYEFTYSDSSAQAIAAWLARNGLAVRQQP